MGQTGLPLLRLDQIVGGVIVGDQPALEPGAKDGEGDLAGPGPFDVKETELGCAGNCYEIAFQRGSAWAPAEGLKPAAEPAAKP